MDALIFCLLCLVCPLFAMSVPAIRAYIADHHALGMWFSGLFIVGMLGTPLVMLYGLASWFAAEVQKWMA